MKTEAPIPGPAAAGGPGKIPAVMFMFADLTSWVYPPGTLARLRRHLDFPDTVVTSDNWREHRDLLRRARVVVSSWGGPQLEANLLEAMPELELYLYGAGSIKGLMSAAAWQRGIRITSAADANAVPVAEFTLAQILFSMKRGWEMMRRAKACDLSAWGYQRELAGNFRSRVGIIGLSMVGKHLCRMLQPFDLRVSAFDPVADDAVFKHHGAERADLDTLFRECDVVSLHAPWLPQTEGMIRGRHFEMMKPGATFINTARGIIVREQEMMAVLQARPDLTAVLDVTHPEPPAADSPLYQMPNVVLTPHLAGAFGPECARLGEFMADELDRHLAGEALRGEVRREDAAGRA